jgi:hypothetical protein
MFSQARQAVLPTSRVKRRPHGFLGPFKFSSVLVAFNMVLLFGVLFILYKSVLDTADNPASARRGWGAGLHSARGGVEAPAVQSHDLFGGGEPLSERETHTELDEEGTEVRPTCLSAASFVCLFTLCTSSVW